MRRLFVIAMSALLFAVMPSSIAEAAEPLYVSVKGFDSSWKTTNAINWVDQYTRTDMQIRQCPTKRNCIIIRTGTVSGVNVGYTTKSIYRDLYKGTQWKVTTITIDVRKASRAHYTNAAKLYLLDHELGHANGLGHRTIACDSRMWPYRNCRNGSIPPRKWTGYQRTVLARN